MPTIKITTTNSLSILSILFMLFIDTTWTLAGRCYQCNSRNPLCQVRVNETLKTDSTPCNGQCYTRLNPADQHTISRGCSWEYGFMQAQKRDALVLERNSVWTFCDAPYCNTEASILLTTVCYQPICDHLRFPEDCNLPQADITCGRFCNNPLCNVTLIHKGIVRHRKPIRYAIGNLTRID